MGVPIYAAYAEPCRWVLYRRRQHTMQVQHLITALGRCQSIAFEVVHDRDFSHRHGIFRGGKKAPKLQSPKAPRLARRRAPPHVGEASSARRAPYRLGQLREAEDSSRACTAASSALLDGHGCTIFFPRQPLGSLLAQSCCGPQAKRQPRPRLPWTCESSLSGSPLTGRK